jgi:hypothetical protein
MNRSAGPTKIAILGSTGITFRGSRNWTKNSGILLAVVLSWGSVLAAEPLAVIAIHHSRVIDYGLRKLVQSTSAYDPDRMGSRTTKAAADIVILLKEDEEVQRLYPAAKTLAPEGYQLAHNGKKLRIIGADERGALYGMLDVAEQLQHNGNNPAKVLEKKEEPRLSFRAIKFNLPIIGYRSRLSLT